MTRSTACKTPAVKIGTLDIAAWNGTGYYLPKTSGVYRLVAATVGEDSYKVLLNGKQILRKFPHMKMARRPDRRL